MFEVVINVCVVELSVFQLSCLSFSDKYLRIMMRGKKKQMNKYERNGKKDLTCWEKSVNIFKIAVTIVA